MITAKEIFLLELMGTGEHYGAQLVKRSRGRIRHFQIYPMLGRLILNELVVTRPEPVTQPGISIPRVLYRRTVKGTRLVRRIHHAPEAPKTKEALDQAVTEELPPFAPMSLAWVLFLAAVFVALWCISH